MSPSLAGESAGDYSGFFYSQAIRCAGGHRGVGVSLLAFGEVAVTPTPCGRLLEKVPFSWFTSLVMS